MVWWKTDGAFKQSNLTTQKEHIYLKICTKGCAILFFAHKQVYLQKGCWCIFMFYCFLLDVYAQSIHDPLQNFGGIRQQRNKVRKNQCYVKRLKTK